MPKKFRGDKADPKDQIIAQITEVARSATHEERTRVLQIIAKAKTSVHAVELWFIAPAMAAILFLEHNRYNRTWAAEGDKSVIEYARRMRNGDWKWNSEGLGFYTDAQVADGQHRLGGAAIAGFVLEVGITFGIEKDAADTIDDGKGRQPSDSAQLEGLTEAKIKQTIVKMASAYLIKTGDKTAKLISVADVKSAMKHNNIMLEQAMEIGSASMQNILEPVLKGTHPQALAYLCLSHGWPPHRVREQMTLFQSGLSMEGEKTPFFVAGEVIKNSRRKVENRDRLTPIKELGIVLYAMLATERGVKALTASAVRNVVKKEMPNPVYPGNPVTPPPVPPLPVPPSIGHVPQQQMSAPA